MDSVAGVLAKLASFDAAAEEASMRVKGEARRVVDGVSVMGVGACGRAVVSVGVQPSASSLRASHLAGSLPVSNAVIEGGIEAVAAATSRLEPSSLIDEFLAVAPHEPLSSSSSCAGESRRPTLPPLGDSSLLWRAPFDASRLLTIAASSSRTALALPPLCAQPRLDTHFTEVRVASDTEGQATNSMSLLRRPGAIEDFHRGSSSHVPFFPGGAELPKEQASRRALDRSTVVLDFDLESLKRSNKLKTRAPGFASACVFGEDDEAAAAVAAPAAEPTEHVATVTTSSVASSRRSNLSFKFVDVFKDDDGDADLFATQVDEDELDTEPDRAAAELDAPAAASASQPKQSASVLNAGEGAAIDALDAELDALLLQSDNWLLQARAQAEKDRKTKEWAVQLDMDMSEFNDLVPNMALRFPFDLDPFQKEAIYHVENGESVFVAAHTSAGKTVVAEYAIALAAKHMTRAIYTSPIKALSNQKFRDFSRTFPEVGLITGDVSINPEASCLIVTTEILRSMLYKGADLIRDVEWVIFDEVHYINDLERGVVWEEVIIMLPAHVNVILLSATVPNTMEFADWVGRTKKKRIFVMATPKRPTPLEHYLLANNEMFKIVDSKRTFLNIGYKSAAASLKEKQAKSKKPVNNSTHAKLLAERSQWPKTVELLRKREMLPVVVFCFSKMKCEELAYSLSTTDLTSNTEKSEIHVFIENSLSQLKGGDRQLPQVLRIKDLLKRGLGVHHGGLLPIIKEMVEMLFARGLCKILFATETFAMGVNMPARTVIFSSIRKHDGQGFRELLSGEYTQMSGRAGRRGLDAVGTVLIACWTEVPDASVIHKMILGTVAMLESKFRLTYNMILNLLRVEDFKVEDMIKRSFSEVQTQRVEPKHRALLNKGEAMLHDLEEIVCIYGEPDIDSHYDLSREVKQLNLDLQDFFWSSKAAVAALAPGRVLQICAKRYRNALAVIVPTSSSKPATAAPARSKDLFDMEELRPKQPMRSQRDSNRSSQRESQGQQHQQQQQQEKTIKVLVPTWMSEEIRIDDEQSRPLWEILSIHVTDISAILKEKIPFDGNDSRQSQETIYAKAAQKLRALQATAESAPFPTVDPVKDLKMNNIDFVEKYVLKGKLLAEMAKSKCHNCPKLNEHHSAMHKRKKLQHSIDQLRFMLSTEHLQLMPEFHMRLEVLRRLNYIDSSNAVQLKGRVAREMNTVTEELIATEMIFDNLLTNLPPEEAVALLSCMLFEEKTENEPLLTPQLEQSKAAMLDLATSLALLQTECGLDIPPQEYCKQLNFGLVEVVFEWARGMPFAEICTLTDVLEGSIVRTIVRLEETCREVRNAARIIGDTQLFTKMEQASALIKRDIVFASSLYVK